VEQAPLNIPKLYEQLVHSSAEISNETIKTSKQIAGEVLDEGALLARGPKPRVAPALRSLKAASSAIAEGGAGEIAVTWTARIAKVGGAATGIVTALLITDPLGGHTASGIAQ